MAKLVDFDNSKSGGTFKKSDAAINLRSKSDDGRNHKLGTLFLKMDNAVDAEMIRLGKEDPDALVKLIQTATIDFQVIEKEPKKVTFAL